MSTDDKQKKPIWTHSTWQPEELQDKSVEFWIPTAEGTAHGIGTLWARRNSEGLLAVEVVTDVVDQHPHEGIHTRYYIPQIGVDSLERHPDPSVAAFRLAEA
ncbi:MAG TPA: hypothetical protein VMS21_07730 [Methylomirabilota bacterium]|nr:hypothetical protein [Methylomirabilota bacterium]